MNKAAIKPRYPGLCCFLLSALGDIVWDQVGHTVKVTKGDPKKVVLRFLAYPRLQVYRTTFT